jgi:hypothetical protein
MSAFEGRRQTMGLRSQIEGWLRSEQEFVRHYA